jgi:hypothetical protein
MFRSLYKSGPQLKCTPEWYHVNGPTPFVLTGILKLHKTRQWALLSNVFQNLFAQEMFGLSKSERDRENNIYSTKQSNETHFHIEKLLYHTYDFS